MVPAKDPFDDPDQHKRLPSVPPSLSVTLPSPTKGEADLPLAERPSPPFMESADSPRPSTCEEDVVPRHMPHPRASQMRPGAEVAADGRGGVQAGGIAVRDFGPNGVTADQHEGKEARSDKSGASTKPSSLDTSSTFVSSNNGATTTTNPFATPSPQPARYETPQTPMPTIPRAIHKNSYLSPDVHQGFSPMSSAAPTPPPKSPFRPAGRRLTSLSSFTSRLGVRRSSTIASNYTAAREAQAREAARRQDALLEDTRIQYSHSVTNFLDAPRLRPSPSTIRVAAELVRARDNSQAYGAQAVLSSKAFWASLLLLQAGIISGTAAVAVIIAGENAGRKVHMGAGHVFWLVISIVLFVVGGVASWLLYLRKKGLSFAGGAGSIWRRLGGDEVGLLDRAVARDIAMSNMNPNVPDEERGGNTAPLPGTGIQTRRPRGIARTPPMNSVVTRDPEWQALYSSPPGLRTMASQSTIREESEDGGTPVRRHGFGYLSSGADSMLGKESDSLKNFNQVSPVKPLKPTPLRRSEPSWPLRSQPQHYQPALFVSVHPERMLAARQRQPQPQSQSQPQAASQEQQQARTDSENNKPPETPVRRGPVLEISNATPGSAHSHAHDVSHFADSNSFEIDALPLPCPPQYIGAQRAASSEYSRAQSANSSVVSLARILIPRSEATGRPRSKSITGVYSVSEAGLDSDSDIHSIAPLRPTYQPKIRQEMSLADFLKTGDLSADASASSKVPRSPGVEQAKKMLASVKGHFAEHGGKKLGSVVREKIGKLKENGVTDAGDGAVGSP